MVFIHSQLFSLKTLAKSKILKYNKKNYKYKEENYVTK